MRSSRFLLILFSTLAAALFFCVESAGAGTASKVRPPAVAGSFYPADPKGLARIVDGFLDRAAPAVSGDVVGLVAPHAGYIYSGPVAAWSYASLKGRKFMRVVVIAPSHYQSIDFSSVYDGDAYATPLGRVPVDCAFAAKLAKTSPLIRLSGAGHGTSPDRPEHALEVQLPFLQRVLGEFQLVPVIMGDQSYQASRALGMALSTLSQGSTTLIVASSDLSHYHPYMEAVALDRKTLNAVQEFDFLSLSRNLERRAWEACGGGPIVAAMIAAEGLGATQAALLKYANSGDTTGERGRVVGYGAVAFVKGPSSGKTQAFSLTQADKNVLLDIARNSVETAVTKQKVYERRAPRGDALTRDRGAFVTLTRKGELRGCIGFVAPTEPLYLTVRDVAMMAALRDTRFPPVTSKELADLEYEISVLSPMRHVLDMREIRAGRDGLLIRNGTNEGLLLPQVAAVQGWDRLTFLEEVCLKAGLPKHAWQDPASDLFRFTALVFGARPPVQALMPLDSLARPAGWPIPEALRPPPRSGPPF